MGSNGNIVDMTGRRFGELTVVRRVASVIRASDGHRQAAWECLCDCGEKIVVRGRFLRLGKKKACGLNGHRARSAEVQATVEERRIYAGMLQRCYNPNNELSYKNYGAKGVRVCRAWRESFTNFLSDIGPRPGPEYSLDRFPDPAGDYKPSNCRWATDSMQNRNKRNTVYITVDGEKMALADYFEKHELGPDILRQRIKRGWSLEKALTTSVRLNSANYVKRTAEPR